MSIVKYNQSKSSGGSGRTARVKRAGSRRVAGGMSDSGGPLQAAVEFIQACGGLEPAKAELAQVEAVAGGGVRSCV